MKGLTLLINDKEARLSCNKMDLNIQDLDSYKVFDLDDDGRISRNEFYEYFKDSWICAFRLLGEQVQRGENPYNISISKITQWAQS